LAKKTWKSFKTRIITADPRSLKLLEVNAHYFPHEKFQRLISNIQKDGALTSVPFAAIDEKTGEYEVLSGNHRVKAAIEAGLPEIQVMVTDDIIPAGQKISIQLSHNSLIGEDDKGTLKFLYETIDDIEGKMYSGLDDKTLESLEKSLTETLREAQLDFKTLSLLFMPDELEEARQKIAEIKEKIKGNKDVWLCYDKDYDTWLDTLEEVGSAHNVSNVATTFSIMLEMIKASRETLINQIVTEKYELRQKNHSHSIPIQTLFGELHISPKDVPVIKKALDFMKKNGLSDVKKISAIGVWAQNYLDSKN